MTAQSRVDKGLYWDAAWSLVEGCSPVSSGCRACWAASAAAMRAGHPNPKIAASARGLTCPGVPLRNVRNHYRGDKLRSDDSAGASVHAETVCSAKPGEGLFAVQPSFNGTVRVREDLLGRPGRTKKPTVFSVWTDLFHESVPDDFILNALETMGGLPRHTFLVLTKRAKRMSRLLDGLPVKFSNVWLGATAENQTQAQERVSYLLAAPAAHRFVSVEPMLEAVTLEGLLLPQSVNHTAPRLDLVIAGPETGPFARPFEARWIADLKRQCDEARVRFFDKSKKPLGRYLPF